jgi:hypothetical protein
MEMRLMIILGKGYIVESVCSTYLKPVITKTLKIRKSLPVVLYDVRRGIFEEIL